MSRVLLSVVCAAVAAGGCARSGSAQAAAGTPAAQTRSSMDMSMSMCPVAVPGTVVAAEETELGISLAFTTTDSRNVGELRRRVQAMARMHEQHRVRGEERGPGSKPGNGGMMGGGMAGRPMPPSRVTVEEIPDGARLVFEPVDPAQKEALREHVRAMAASEGGARVMHGDCPMMQMMMQGGSVPSPTATPEEEHESHHKE